jgi:hypothetical protein
MCSCARVFWIEVDMTIDMTTTDCCAGAALRPKRYRKQLCSKKQNCPQERRCIQLCLVAVVLKEPDGWILHYLFLVIVLEARLSSSAMYSRRKEKHIKHYATWFEGRRSVVKAIDGVRHTINSKLACTVYISWSQASRCTAPHCQTCSAADHRWTRFAH